MIYYKSNRGILYHGDCLDVMKKMPDNYFSAIITDPPYGINFMQKHWDRGIPGVVYWEEALRVCKPGSFLLSFGGTRMFHRLTCAIEDAGWEIRDCVMWLYGTGFPKSHNISKAIDKSKGEYIPGEILPSSRTSKNSQTGIANTFRIKTASNPQTPEAKLWNGYGTALKPAWEPIIVAMKPTDGTYAQNALKHGVAGLNIDECRIKLAKDGEDPRLGGKGSWSTDKMAKNVFQGGWDGKEVKSSDSGRWPANVILTHHLECEEKGTRKVKTSVNHHISKTSIFDKGSKAREGTDYADKNGMEAMENWDCHPDCPVRILDEQAPKSGAFAPVKSGQSGKGKGIYGEFKEKGDDGATFHNDGLTGASRFFYCAKASKSERNKGLDSLTPKRVSDGRSVINDTAYQRDKTLRKNTHPTVKPRKLIRYLLRITTMPNGGIVLDPFIGSGTTAVECESLNRKWVGIELEEENCEISKLRIEAEIKDDKATTSFFEEEI